MGSFDNRNRSRGVTLVELLVAIGIIGILSSLSLVAVQRSREARCALFQRGAVACARCRIYTRLGIVEIRKTACFEGHAP